MARTLSIDSEVNIGTTVSILFPAARTRPRTAEVVTVKDDADNVVPVRIRAAE